MKRRIAYGRTPAADAALTKGWATLDEFNALPTKTKRDITTALRAACATMLDSSESTLALLHLADERRADQFGTVLDAVSNAAVGLATAQTYFSVIVPKGKKESHENN